MRRLEEIGKRILEQRKARRYSRVQLAEKAGLSSRFLADVEAGRGNIALSRLLDLCDALGVPLAVLAADATPVVSSRGTTPGDQNHESVLLASLLSLLSRCNRRQLEEAQLWLSQHVVQTQRSMVALIGLRGAGKTTIGRRVAELLNMPFVELDNLIERKAGLTLQNIFEVHGEEYYRTLEMEVLRHFLAAADSSILATGGGMVTRPETYALLQEHCCTVWLTAAPKDHWDRVLRQDPRPMTDYPNAFARLQSLLEQRHGLYAQAQWTVDTSRLGVERSARKIVSIVRGKRSAIRSDRCN